MQVDRNVERLGALEDRPEPLVVEEHAVGESVDHRALEAELDAAFELVGGRLGIGGRQRREGGEARGVRLHGGVQPVVDAPRQRHGVGAGQLLGRGRAMRQHLDVDAGLVHLLDAQLAEIVQPLRGIARPPGFDARIGRRQFGIPIVLLQRDDWTFRLLHHDVLCPRWSDGVPSNGGAGCHEIAKRMRIGRDRPSDRSTRVRQVLDTVHRVRLPSWMSPSDRTPRIPIP